MSAAAVLPRERARWDVLRALERLERLERRAPREEAQPGRPRVVDVLRDHGEAYLRLHGAALPEHSRRVLGRLLTCRTWTLGGQLARCPSCEDLQLLPNACRDRHCPTCPAVRRWRWLEQRQQRALDVPHFHSVFTVPPELRALLFENQRALYGALMAAAAAAVRWACRRALGEEATPAFTAVLHTWNRAQELHPHVHVVLAAGALSADGARWLLPARQALLPADDEVRARFRRSLLLRIRRAWTRGQLRLPAGWDEAELQRQLARAAKRRWHVYSKRTLVSLEAYEYLARYVRSVGLSSARILAYDQVHATIATRDGRSVRRHGLELVRLLLLHVLPPGFVRVRHYGLFVSRHRQRLEAARRLIAEQGLGCGHAAELEGREEEPRAQPQDPGAQREPEVVLARGGAGEGQGQGQGQGTWQEVCARFGFQVQRCPHCDLPLEYLRLPPLPLRARGRERERAARTSVGAHQQTGPP